MALSGQITVATAGTAVQGTDVAGMRFLLAADPGNTGEVYVGNDGSNDVTASNGFPLPASGVVVTVVNLNRLWFDADTDGDKAGWLKLAE